MAKPVNRPMNNAIQRPASQQIHRAIKRQAGLTLISWIIVLVFLLFQGVIAMKVIPVYLTDASVKTIMEKLPDDPEAHGLSAKKLKIMVAKRLNINSVYSVPVSSIIVKKSRGVNVVTIDYEPRGTLFGNLEYIVSFHHEARVPTR